MKKRILALALTLVMAMSLITAQAAPAEFKDVQSGDWFHDGVQYVCENGLMKGTGEGLFSPNQSTTRGMIVTILWRMEGEPAAETADFTDVADGQWYTEAVAWAASEGVVTGYGGGLFGPNDTITRQQLAAILFRYAGTCGYDTTGRADLSGYTDAGVVASWAADALAWAVDAKLISGTDTVTLSPNGSATRAQVAIILMRFCETFGGETDQPGQVEPKPETPPAGPSGPSAPSGPSTPSGPSAPVTPEKPEIDVPAAGSIGYEEYQALSGEQQAAYMEAFDSVADFFTWYNQAKAEYDASQDRIEIGGDGNIDLGDIINGTD